ncbi:hypothetical protein GLOIN_2v1844525 [Rhizophagus irregularis DAOM 181602=DAOM 197198]|uniref:Uncharacterized protein n=2 Tax=Rhizophagus irregularis (strain DAOM 181602 / DAOM 197198 / MUCL 43194) TaxID=747089 RepID=A0A2P4PKB5_RHIID|nr:hypothetical protein GLOIN_2v1844525 [Rhizophagus irregularis DAOM 181602=DAOM 197198]POG65834.1 hypothetical protein GLOIN_2v1844525 [Rhizophagus irregularis DAOM 181602=DAOM 197198]GBC37535.2 hypothetical protein GLOIN_2v1844525 [Rhizophagus irregularis DAOM 181602=DAOM 197198]|eukprot:XP_025172700.1 hypothetical protein GLOIN_2v1844525 [Rhizophagus irregularis DAOM 181602=DAOM 197198]
MKLQSFYLLTFIFMCFYIMDIKAYNSDTNLDLILCSCRIWVEDSNGNRIAGDKNYHDCSYNSYGSNYHETLNFSDQTYTVYAKVEASFEKTKKRGPYNGNTCFHIHGNVDHWEFDETSC